MNRKTAVVAVLSLLLGSGIGFLAAHSLYKLPTPSRSAYIVNQLNTVALLKECKPKDARFLSPPAGSAEEDRYGYHGFYTASWTDSKDATNVAGILEKKLQELMESKGYQLSRSGQNETVGNPTFQEWSKQYGYHHPDWSVGGTIFVWIHHDVGQKWSVVMSYYVAHDPSR